MVQPHEPEPVRTPPPRVEQPAEPDQERQESTEEKPPQPEDNGRIERFPER